MRPAPGGSPTAVQQDTPPVPFAVLVLSDDAFRIAFQAHFDATTTVPDAESKAKVTTSQVITALRGKDHEARAPDPGRGVALNAPKAQVRHTRTFGVPVPCAAIPLVMCGRCQAAWSRCHGAGRSRQVCMCDQVRVCHQRPVQSSLRVLYMVTVSPVNEAGQETGRPST